jgi:hypothetical protein
MQLRHGILSVALLIVGLTLSGCGGSPTAPASAVNGVRVHGMAVGTADAASIGGFRAMSHRPSDITVTVQGTSITTKVSVSGTFELEGLPAGTFTLEFSVNGTSTGTITITSVPGEADVNVVVQIDTTVVVIVKVEINGDDKTDEQKQHNEHGDDDGDKTCLIHGGRAGRGIELEGNVSSVAGTSFQMTTEGERANAPIDVNASAASFKCDGADSLDDKKPGGPCDATLLKAGNKVHVRGTLVTCTLTAAQVTATEVKFQGGHD